MKKTESILVINTSFKGASIALASWSEGSYELLAVAHFFSNQVAAARLPGLLESVLSVSGSHLAEISHVLVDTGPGSFTGIKVGLSFTTGLFAGLKNCMIWGISGMESLAYCNPAVEWFLPATKTQGYLARWETSGTAIYSVEYEHNSLTMIAENTRQCLPYTTQEGHRIEVLQSWRIAEDFFSSQAIGFNRNELGVYGGMIIHGMLNYFRDHKDSLHPAVPQPRYIRKSAPEEAIEKKRRT